MRTSLNSRRLSCEVYFYTKLYIGVMNVGITKFRVGALLSAATCFQWRRRTRICTGMIEKIKQKLEK